MFGGRTRVAKRMGSPGLSHSICAYTPPPRWAALCRQPLAWPVGERGALLIIVAALRQVCQGPAETALQQVLPAGRGRGGGQERFMSHPVLL